MKKHLWEVDHPYYMNGGNYYSNDCSHHYEDWEDFFEDWGDADIDYNWVIRFDWIPDEDDSSKMEFRVAIFGQRKSILQSCHVQIKKSDEAKVIEYLKPHFEYTKEMWEPFI